MKIRVHCFECEELGRKKDSGKIPPYVPAYPYWDAPIIDLEKWPCFEMQCPQGHINRFVISNELYELLFQQATYCIMDGYYREAIATYNAALERFFEYACELLTYDYLGGENAGEFEKVWKHISRYSERQLGAFYFVWICKFKSAPSLIDEKMVSLRNNVVHKGIFASKKEAEMFGEYVFNYIKQANKQIEESFDVDKISLLKVGRLIRFTRKDMQKYFDSPIKRTVDGKELYWGNRCIFIPSFLSSENIQNYKECFKEINNPNYGFIK